AGAVTWWREISGRPRSRECWATDARRPSRWSTHGHCCAVAVRNSREAGAYNVDAMIDAILKKIFGTKHERDVKRMLPVVSTINAPEPAMQALDHSALPAQT